MGEFKIKNKIDFCNEPLGRKNPKYANEHGMPRQFTLISHIHPFSTSKRTRIITVVRLRSQLCIDDRVSLTHFIKSFCLKQRNRTSTTKCSQTRILYRFSSIGITCAASSFFDINALMVQFEKSGQTYQFKVQEVCSLHIPPPWNLPNLLPLQSQKRDK